jgi:predicted dehydrogenase
VLLALRMIKEGEIGVIQEIRTRGKEDVRAGGEDMAVLGPHLFDLMRMFAGDPEWVFAHVTENGQDISRKPIRTASEPVGPIAGNQVAAMFAFHNGVHGYFASKTSDVPNASRFGFYVYGSKGAVFVGITKYPEQSLVLHSASWLPDRSAAWQPIAPPDGKPLTRERANTLMALDLIQAIEEKREPASSVASARWTVEMLQGIYLSQTTKSPVTFPLKQRRHPLENS